MKENRLVNECYLGMRVGTAIRLHDRSDGTLRVDLEDTHQRVCVDLPYPVARRLLEGLQRDSRSWPELARPLDA